MLIRNLASWAGLRFEVQPEEIVELDDEVALARIAAGLAEEAPHYGPPPPPSSARKRGN